MNVAQVFVRRRNLLAFLHNLIKISFFLLFRNQMISLKIKSEAWFKLISLNSITISFRIWIHHFFNRNAAEQFLRHFWINRLEQVVGTLDARRWHLWKQASRGAIAVRNAAAHTVRHGRFRHLISLREINHWFFGRSHRRLNSLFLVGAI